MSDESLSSVPEEISASGPPPLAHAWFVALMCVVGLAMLTIAITFGVHRYHLGQLAKRQSILKNDPKYKDVPSQLEQYHAMLKEYNQILLDAPKEQREKNKILVMLEGARTRKAQLEARTDLPEGEKERLLVVAEREVAGLMIDLNSNASSAQRADLAKKNKAIACKKITEMIPTLDDVALQRRWVAETENLCKPLE